MRVALDSALIRHDLAALCERVDLQALSGRHLLLTGSTGFFGQWLLAALAYLNEQGADIRVTAVSRAPGRFAQRYPEYFKQSWLQWLEADVRYPLPTPAGELDMVIHAATDTLAAAHAEPLQIFATVIDGARHVLDHAVRAGARRVLFTGSGAQYGRWPAGTPIRETSALACDSTQAAQAYGEAKRAQEMLGALYAHQHGLQVVFARCFAFAGPGLALDAHFAFGNLLRDALWRPALSLNSAGTHWRSYLYAADLAGWLFSLLLRGEDGRAYNVGSDQAISTHELAQRMRALLAPDKPVLIARAAGGDSYYVPDIQQARSLGLDVWTSLDEAIVRSARWATGG